MKYLLDVNLLLAGIWTTHPNHAVAQQWLAGKQVVLCPISELGFVRISTGSKALNLPMEQVRTVLSKFARDKSVKRIPDDLPALDSHPKTSNQVTDHYLADLAAKHGLKLATLDAQLKHPAAELVR